MKDEQRSQAVRFPGEVERTKKELTDSYGNPIKDPFLATDSATDETSETTKKSGIFVIPGYASGLLTDPVPHKPEQRSQSGFAPDQLVPTNDKVGVNRNQRPPIVLPSFDLIAPLPEELEAPPSSNNQNTFNPTQSNNVQQNTFIPIPPPSNANLIPTGFSQEGPILISEGQVGDFALKPADGLLPPKDDSELEPAVLSQRTNTVTPSSIAPIIPKSTVTTIPVPGKYSGGFGGSSGILGGNRKTISSNSIPSTPQIQPQVIQPQPAPRPISTSSDNKKFTLGGFGGSPGVLTAPSINFLPPPEPEQSFVPIIQPEEPLQIPSTSLLAPFPLPENLAPVDRLQAQVPQQTLPIVPAKLPTDTGKYTGSFGGSQGVLGQNRPAVNTNIIQTTRPPFTTTPLTVQTTTAPTETRNNVGKYTGGFGGPAGVLESNFKPFPTLYTPLESKTVENSRPALSQVPGGFGGAPGVLKPFDGKRSS